LCYVFLIRNGQGSWIYCGQKTSLNYLYTTLQRNLITTWRISLCEWHLKRKAACCANISAERKNSLLRSYKIVFHFSTLRSDRQTLKYSSLYHSAAPKWIFFTVLRFEIRKYPNVFAISFIQVSVQMPVEISEFKKCQFKMYL
jgi:hypothetical protein